jgi:hypothetical protein
MTTAKEPTMTTASTLLTQGTLLYRWCHALLLATRTSLRKPADWRAQAALRESAAAAAVTRALANSVRKSDPGFASDLYAAADRHERDREAPDR